jgi:hypothetical protein
VSKLTSALRAKPTAPGALRYPVYLATVIVVWSALSLAHVGFARAAVFGAGAGFVADLALEAWWRRRERQRDLENGFVARRDDAS